MKKKLPRGIDSFSKLMDRSFYYVDKTLLIKELIDCQSEVTLITRPRRFGKTLNMSMLAHFFDITRDSTGLFTDLKIMEHEDIVAEYMNKFPVIFLSLKGVVSTTYEGSLEKMAYIVSKLYQSNRYLLESDSFDGSELLLSRKYADRQASSDELELSLHHLSWMLQSYHRRRVIILLDERDPLKPRGGQRTGGLHAAASRQEQARPGDRVQTPQEGWRGRHRRYDRARQGSCGRGSSANWESRICSGDVGRRLRNSTRVRRCLQREAL